MSCSPGWSRRVDVRRVDVTGTNRNQREPTGTNRNQQEPTGTNRRGMMATANREPTSERNLDGYGAPTIPWEKVRDVLNRSIPQEPGSGGPDRHTCWLATVRPDGRPHVVPVGVLQADGAFYFNAGAATRKAKNLAHSPHCVITVATHDFDLVLEGSAVKV